MCPYQMFLCVCLAVFSYNYETCSSNKHKCSVFGDCRDYAAGYCCHCKPGYYGNGKDCVAEGEFTSQPGLLSLTKSKCKKIYI